MLIKRWDCFESRNVVRLLGITERELRYWAVLGIVKPQIAAAAGRPGIRRRYSFKNVVQAGLVQMLLAKPDCRLDPLSVPLPVVEQCVQKLPCLVL